MPSPEAEDHYYAALDLFAEGKHDEAIAEYRAAIANKPWRSAEFPWVDYRRFKR